MNSNRHLIIKDKHGKVIQKIDIEEQLNQPDPHTNKIELDGKNSSAPYTIDLSALSNYPELVYLSFRNYPNLQVPSLYPLYNNKNLEGINVQDGCPRMLHGEWDITPLFESLRYRKLIKTTESFRRTPRKYFIGWNITTWLHPQDFSMLQLMLQIPDRYFADGDDEDETRDIVIQYKPLENIKDWYQIRRFLWEVKGKTCHLTAQHSMLNGLGLSHYGFIESDLIKDLLSISRDYAVDEARREFEPILISQVCSQIDKKRTTIGMVIDDKLLDNKEFAKRLPQILELRKSEIEKIYVPVIRGSAIWESLYFTAYGYQILNSLGRMIYKPDNRDVVLNAFSESGINLQIREFDSARDGIDFAQRQLNDSLVSEPLRNYIRLLPDSLFSKTYS